MPLKILHLVASMDPKSGGVCQAVRMIIRGLSSLPTLNEVASQDSPDAVYLGSDDFTIHATGPAKTPWQYSRALAPWLEQNLAKFDVVILHGLWLHNGFALQKAIKRGAKENGGKAKSPRYFVMPHGMLDPYFQKASGRKLKALRNMLYWRFIESMVVNNAAGLLFTCEEEQRLAAQSFRPYHPARQWVVGLGVEAPPASTPEMFQAFSATCPGVDAAPYILFLGRIHEKKGIDLVIEAYAKAAEGKPLYNLVIAGPDPDSSYGREMQSLANHIPQVKRKIFFPGMLTGKAKWGAIYGSEAFVLASHQENFGIAVVEALASNKPVLISNQVNIWKEIQEGGAGIVKQDTLTGVTELFTTWYAKSGESQQAMGEAAGKCFEKHFSIPAAAEKLYSAVCS